MMHRMSKSGHKLGTCNNTGPTYIVDVYVDGYRIKGFTELFAMPLVELVAQIFYSRANF
jgi:hypothetical protein